MNIHEHQAKEILKDFGAPVSNGVVITSTDEILEKIKNLNSKEFVLKAQIHAGGRGKAGGVKLIKDYSDKLIEKALELEGTITGEHGIGLQKKHYLLKEHPDNLPVMKSIKRSLDVNNIMNPGKVFDLN